MKDNILGQIDSNVICVDWSKLAASLDYISVLPNVPLTGQMIAHFINRLINATNVSLNDIQCIGHSLGAHVCGFVGKAFSSNKISKITGLDPAWPGFDHKDPKTRLDPSDANLVIVEHTSSGVVASGGPTTFFLLNIGIKNVFLLTKLLRPSSGGPRLRLCIEV